MAKRKPTINTKLDIGCGPVKSAGFDGMDMHPYEGVDYVHDLDSQGNWPIPDDRYAYVLARHVIEHLRDLRKFFSEVHRISKDGGVIRIETPHYSSRNSWADPTHIHHLSAGFCDPFLKSYLGEQFPRFVLMSRTITFGSFLLTWPAQLYCKLFGYDSYERHFAWIMPASSVIIELVVVNQVKQTVHTMEQAA